VKTYITITLGRVKKRLAKIGGKNKELSEIDNILLFLTRMI